MSNMKYITCNRKSRVGVNIYSRLITMNFCHNNNSTHTYVHTPLPEPFEGLFNLGMGHMCRSRQRPECWESASERYMKIGKINKVIEVEKNTITTKLITLAERKEFPDFSEEFREDIIQRYNSTDTYPRNKNKINICIHMRRGDTDEPNDLPSDKQGQFYLRRVSDSFLNEVLKKINQFIKKPVSINVHSDSVLDMEKFETYDFEINTNFNDTPEQAMQDMIACDILFRSGISSFSGVCAFYNQNLIISDVPTGYEGLYSMGNSYDLADFASLAEMARFSEYFGYEDKLEIRKILKGSKSVIKILNGSKSVMMHGSEFHIVGDSYLNGSNGKEKDEEKAVECWLNGAELDNVQCMKNLAWAYLHGIGVKANALESGRFINKANKAEKENLSRKIEGLNRESIRQEERRQSTKVYPNDIEVGQNDIVLLTQYYISKCPMREAENDLALRRNIQNPSIKKIVLFLEDDIDIPFKSDKVERVLINDRMTYKDGFDYMRGKPGVKIIANSDIYFELDIIELVNADFTNRLLCMSRHDLEWDGKIVPPKPCQILGVGDLSEVKESQSSDAWIWRDLPSFNSNIYLGVYCCETLMLTKAIAKKIEVINVGKLYNAVHVHWSEVRTQKNSEGGSFYSRDNFGEFVVATDKSEIGL